MTNINYDEAKGWSAIFQKPEIRIENIGSSLDIDGKAYDLKLLRESSSKEFEDSLGSGTEFKFISDMPVRVSIYLRQYQDRQLLGIKGRLENSDRECKIFDFTIAKGMLINLGCKSDEISVH